MEAHRQSKYLGGNEIDAERNAQPILLPFAFCAQRTHTYAQCASYGLYLHEHEILFAVIFLLLPTTDRVLIEILHTTKNNSANDNQLNRTRNEMRYNFFVGFMR